MNLTMISFLLAFFALATPVVCLLNITVDDDGPAIVYQGEWSTDTNSFSKAASYGGLNQFSYDPSATATFRFQGSFACLFLTFVQVHIDSQVLRFTTWLPCGVVILHQGPHLFLSIRDPRFG